MKKWLANGHQTSQQVLPSGVAILEDFKNMDAFEKSINRAF
ncbi:MAG: hypothetical protein R2784_14615 [Saprospiraceae bacterium]